MVKGEQIVTKKNRSLLYIIALARFTTQRQLCKIAPTIAGLSSDRGAIQRQLIKLVQKELITGSNPKLCLGRLRVTKKGLDHLLEHHAGFYTLTKGLRIYVPTFDSRFVGHELGLNELWATFAQSGALERWMTSYEIDIHRRKRRRMAHKQYDALAVVKTSVGQPFLMALEYELSLKTASDYEGAIKAINNDRPNIPFVLYICPTRIIKNTLARRFKGIPNVFFAEEEDVHHNPLGPMYAFVEQIRADGSINLDTLDKMLITLGGHFDYPAFVSTFDDEGNEMDLAYERDPVLHDEHVLDPYSSP